LPPILTDPRADAHAREGWLSHRRGDVWWAIGRNSEGAALAAGATSNMG